jgi:hypothetical protein
MRNEFMIRVPALQVADKLISAGHHSLLITH